MNKVYVLHTSDFEGYMVYGIFSTRELADQARNESRNPYNGLWVEEVIVDKFDKDLTDVLSGLK